MGAKVTCSQNARFSARNWRYQCLLMNYLTGWNIQTSRICGRSRLGHNVGSRERDNGGQLIENRLNSTGRCYDWKIPDFLKIYGRFDRFIAGKCSEVGEYMMFVVIPKCTLKFGS